MRPKTSMNQQQSPLSQNDSHHLLKGSTSIDHFEFVGWDAVELAIMHFLDSESLEDYDYGLCIELEIPHSAKDTLNGCHTTSITSHIVSPLSNHTSHTVTLTAYHPNNNSSESLIVDPLYKNTDTNALNKNQPSDTGIIPVSNIIPNSVNINANLLSPDKTIYRHGNPALCAVVTVFQEPERKSCRRLTFKMDEIPEVTCLEKNPETAVSLAQQICGRNILFESAPSFDGDWEESLMELPVKRRVITLKKFQAMLLHELKRANDETDKLARNIFENGSIDSIGLSNNSIEDDLSNDSLKFDINTLTEWFQRVADSYSRGVLLVKVSMTGQKFLRTVKVDSEFFSVSLPQGGFRSTHLCYMETAKLGYASGEFMRLIDVTELGSEMSEAARNELIFLLRVKVRMAKYMFGDGSATVLRANTKGKELRHMTTLGGIDALNESDGNIENDEEECHEFIIDDSLQNIREQEHSKVQNALPFDPYPSTSFRQQSL